MPSIIPWSTGTAAVASAGFATTAIVFITMNQFLMQSKISLSQQNLTAAKTGIEEAFVVLDSDEPTRRIAWVNAARLILRSNQLSSQITSNEHKAEWRLFVELWKIRYLKFITATTEYYFGIGDLEHFPKKLRILPKDIEKIAKLSYAEHSVEIGGHSGTISGSKNLSERSIRVIYDFISQYEANDDPLRNVQGFDDDSKEMLSYKNYYGLWAYFEINKKYDFVGGEVHENDPT